MSKAKRYKSPRGFSKYQIDRAYQIANDIAEDINNKDTRAELRMAIAYFRDRECVESQKRADLESRLALYQSAKGIMDLALKEPKP
jgi:hypothetical protein